MKKYFEKGGGWGDLENCAYLWFYHALAKSGSKRVANIRLRALILWKRGNTQKATCTTLPQNLTILDQN